MSTQYRLVQSGKTASGGCSAGQGSSEPVAPRIYLFIIYYIIANLKNSTEKFRPSFI
jgi:carbohydrate-binding DOMON domain-containing protein